MSQKSEGLEYTSAEENVLLLTANQNLHVFVPKWDEVRKALFKLKAINSGLRG